MPKKWHCVTNILTKYDRYGKCYGFDANPDPDLAPSFTDEAKIFGENFNLKVHKNENLSKIQRNYFQRPQKCPGGLRIRPDP